VVVALLVGAWLLFSSDDRAALIPKIPAALNEKGGAPEPVLSRDAVAPAPEEASRTGFVNPPRLEPRSRKPIKPAVEGPKTRRQGRPPKPAARSRRRSRTGQARVEAAKPVEPPKPPPGEHANAGTGETGGGGNPRQGRRTAEARAEGAEGLLVRPGNVARGPRVYGQENAEPASRSSPPDSWGAGHRKRTVWCDPPFACGDRFKVRIAAASAE
jgi:hypothetical protein